jgi:tRNA 2-thiouridine synthesizing protein A
MSDMTTLDVKGLNCPLPVLRARKALGGLKAGDTLRVLATDPGASRDFEAFCRAGDATLLSAREESGVFTFEIRKAG